MKALATLAGRLDDFLNPIVVKELRQAVRSRFVSGVLMLLLVIQLLVVGIFVMIRAAEPQSFSEGREITTVLYGVLTFSCILFVPLYAGVRLAWERGETQMDLMYTTTISPGAIVRGKLVGAAAITALIYSACMPFMTFTYLLRGVDLPTVFFLLAAGFIEVVVASQFALFVACISASRPLKVLMGLIALNFLFGGAIAGGTGLPAWLFRGGVIYGGWDFWAITLTVMAFAAMATGLLYFLSVAMISPPSADRMRPVRLYMLALWLTSGILLALWVLNNGDWAPWEAWTYGWAFGLAFLFPVALSERESWGPRIRSGLPRSRLRRALSLILTTGSPGAFFGVALMILLTWGAFEIVAAAYKAYGLVRVAPNADCTQFIIGIALYGMAYGLTAFLLRKLLGLAKLNIPVGYTWLIAYMMVAAGSLGPYVLCFLLYYNDGSSAIFQDRIWIVTSPMMILQKEFRMVRLVAAGFWASAALVASMPWLIRQIAAFRPLEPAAPAQVAEPPAAPSGLP